MRSFLYDALAAEYGIIVRSADPVALRARLYPLRKSDPSLHELGFVLSPDAPDTDLWIVRKVRPNAEK